MLLFLTHARPGRFGRRDLSAAVTSLSARPEHLITWNVASLRALLRKRPDALTELVQAYSPAAICLQETKLQTSHVDEHRDVLEGYRSFWSCSTARKGYSGTAVFLRDDIEMAEASCGIGDETADREGRVITLSLPKCHLVTCYTPNSGEELRRLDYRTKTFEPSMLSYLQKLAAERPVVFCGDLNVAHKEIDLHNPDGNRRSAGFTDEEREEFSNLLEGSGMVDAFRAIYPSKEGMYTYWSYRARSRDRNAGWRLDYFVVSPQLMSLVDDCQHLNAVLGSDHCPVLLTLKNRDLL